MIDVEFAKELVGRVLGAEVLVSGLSGTSESVLEANVDGLFFVVDGRKSAGGRMRRRMVVGFS